MLFYETPHRAKLSRTPSGGENSREQGHWRRGKLYMESHSVRRTRIKNAHMSVQFRPVRLVARITPPTSSPWARPPTRSMRMTMRMTMRTSTTGMTKVAAMKTSRPAQPRAAPRLRSSPQPWQASHPGPFSNWLATSLRPSSDDGRLWFWQSTHRHDPALHNRPWRKHTQ